MKFLSKKNIFIFFIALAVFAIIEWNTHLFKLCSGGYYDVCINILAVALYGSTALALLLVPIVFTLPFRTQVFEAWRNFALWAVPVTLVLSALLVLGGEGSSYFSFGFGPFILMLLYGTYILISFIIIGRAWWMGRNSSK